MKRLGALFLLVALVYFRPGFFSVESISGQLLSEAAEPMSQEVFDALSQPFHYLGKGRQAYAFVSADGNWVIKFFNQKYFRLPFWAAAFPKERGKREKRKKFYLSSYKIASKMLKEETGIVYLHQGPSLSSLPRLLATDKLGCSHAIDLAEIPFVLQRKADPFYPALQAMTPEELDLALAQFVSIIASRIDLRIGDGDHDVENNFGFLGGRVLHLDPGRLYLDENLWEREKLKKEWWSATHQFRKWLEENHPDHVPFFERAIETNLQRILQRPLYTNYQK